MRIGKLATSCNVSGGPVYKVAYATQLLGVELYDGQNNLLGTVQDAILEPESGNIGFYIVKPAKGDGLVMVRLRAINIPKEALLPGGTLSLVLLTEPNVFWEAPRINNVDEADDFAHAKQDAAVLGQIASPVVGGYLGGKRIIYAHLILRNVTLPGYICSVDSL